MNSIPYHFNRNLHSLSGARTCLAQILEGYSVSSLLDVGAGIGTWLKAAQELRIPDVAGIDGIRAASTELHVRPDLIQVFDLTKRASLGRSFDVVLCLEVAEHLDEAFAEGLIATLCAHGDLVFFSAAAPGQHGEHHVNCQWPTYWQAKFNALGYACQDSVRTRIWNNDAIEPWYRQNIFSAHRDPDRAGMEQRIAHLIHPDMTQHMDFPDSPLGRRLSNLTEGRHRPLHYLRLLNRSVLRHVTRAKAAG